MPTFEIEQYELHAQTYRIEAASEAEAIKRLFTISRLVPCEPDNHFSSNGRQCHVETNCEASLRHQRQRLFNCREQHCQAA